MFRKKPNRTIERLQIQLLEKQNRSEELKIRLMEQVIKQSKQTRELLDEVEGTKNQLNEIFRPGDVEERIHDDSKAAKKRWSKSVDVRELIEAEKA